MTIHQLHYQQVLNMSRDEAWQFFSSPHHLNTITPDFFTITPASKVPEEIYSGLMIAYTMQAVFNWPIAWLSEISHCASGHYFIYEQRIGPFKFWSHEVRITEQDKGVMLEDIVFYSMPFGLFGSLCHKLMIADKLADIFNTRRKYLAQRWGVLS